MSKLDRLLLENHKTEISSLTEWDIWEISRAIKRLREAGLVVTVGWGKIRVYQGENNDQERFD